MALVVNDVPVKWVALQQVELAQHRPALPLWLRTLLRWVYQRYGWAAIEGLQFRGVYDSEADARWAANCAGGSYRSLPYNATLPEETSQFSVYDHPQCEASDEYRNRQLPFVAIPRVELQQLREATENAQV